MRCNALSMGFPTIVKLLATGALCLALAFRHIDFSVFEDLSLSALKTDEAYLNGQLNGALVVALFLFIHVFAEVRPPARSASPPPSTSAPQSAAA